MRDWESSTVRENVYKYQGFYIIHLAFTENNKLDQHVLICRKDYLRNGRIQNTEFKVAGKDYDDARSKAIDKINQFLPIQASH